MRLSSDEVAELLLAMSETMSPLPWQLLLFGSRTDDLLKGGDIDLLVVLENEEDWNAACGFKTALLVAMKDRLGEQRIDLAFVTNDWVSKSAFSAHVRPGAVLPGSNW